MNYEAEQQELLRQTMNQAYKKGREEEIIQRLLTRCSTIKAQDDVNLIHEAVAVIRTQKRTLEFYRSGQPDRRSRPRKESHEQQ